jgi:glycosyltransferase involved in cell wall biosynthesis
MPVLPIQENTEFCRPYGWRDERDAKNSVSPENTDMQISVIIPAFNEEHSIGKVIADIPKDCVQEIIVVDNGSTDQTAEIAQSSGARVVREERKGYGYACLAGIVNLNAPGIVVFLDGDYSDYPSEMPLLTHPILCGEAELVIGSRIRGTREKGALLPQARFGNTLATFLIRLLFGVCYTDLGPFRAIRYDRLLEMNMQDKTFGWTVEMQLRAAKMGMRVCEVPVSYRKRIGQSKITGTVQGTIKAAYKILATIFRYGLAERFGFRNYQSP